MLDSIKVSSKMGAKGLHGFFTITIAKDRTLVLIWKYECTYHLFIFS